ncbi:hypothetical protein EXIGLDRAFT_751236 [Exidia glandulosa HHB12029]|uniref:Sc15 protein n=1 Tax=Exidia glandulosa HHB12029 TaxID=1314781 RepID=A0A165FP21_EXIGL|nr:hypothetical protein EXIGLDRAFT_751236 [Exidia glandulosa HHB12029]
MKFGYIASLLLAVTVGTSAVSVQPRDDNSDIMAVLQDFQATTETILPQITAFAQSGNATAADVMPLIGELNTAAHTAIDALTDIRSSTNGAVRPSDPEVANIMSSTLNDITTTLSAAKASIPGLDAQIVALDDPITTILMLLEGLVMGTLTLIGISVVGVSVLLLTLGLGLVLATLGL